MITDLHIKANRVSRDSAAFARHGAYLAVHIVLLCLIILYAIDAQFTYAKDELGSSTVERALRLFALGVMLYYILDWKCRLRGLLRWSAVHWAIILFALNVAIHIYLMPWTAYEKALAIYRYLYWVPVFWFMTVVGYRFQRNVKILVCYLFVFLAVFIPQLIMQLLSRHEIKAIGVGYRLLDLWPLLMLFAVRYRKSPAFKNILALAIGVLVVASLKRGAILAFLGALVAPFLCTIEWRRLDLRLLARRFVAVVVPCITIVIIVVMNAAAFQERFEDFGSDKMGSGRAEFYEYIWEHWSQSPVFGKVFWFGFGHDSVSSFLGEFYAEIYAHSDFLEYVHDYGVVGLGLYSFILGAMFHYCWQDWQRRSHFAEPALIFCIMVAMRALYSGLLAVPFSMILPAVFLGLWMGKREQHRIQTKIPYCR